MKKFQRNFLMILVLAVTFSFLFLSAAATPGDVPPDERRVMETYYPQAGEPFPKDPAERIRQYFPDDPELILKIPSVEMIERSNAYNELVKVDAGAEVPLLSPDWATVGMFLYDPAVSPLQSSLFCNGASPPPPEYNYLILSRFPHYDRNGTFVIRDVSFGELLNATKTQFHGYGISSSGYLEVRVVSSSGYSKKDLLNVYNLIQKVAFMNGYDTAIPVIFLEAPVYPPIQSAPPSSVTHVDESVWDRVLAWLSAAYEERLRIHF